ncbi:MAG TPA: hypothetical protein VNA21_01105 [Steroidobacteraceae bacterium]|nr:hypothetical protein [Steroidobacteraceae bacterium]
MTFEEMQKHWAKLDLTLESSAAPARVRDLRSAKSSMAKQRLWLAADIVVHAIAAVALGGFVVSHFSEPAMLLSALTLHIVVIALMISSVRQLVALSYVDWGGAVTTAQQHIESVRLLRMRTIKWALTLAPLLWVPLLAVAVEAGVGIDIYAAFSKLWLITNFLFGVVFLGAVLFVSKRFGDRLRQGSWLSRLMDNFAGRSLARTAKFLGELSKFQAGT